jgi:hypothetical protein
LESNSKDYIATYDAFTVDTEDPEVEPVLFMDADKVRKEDKVNRILGKEFS